MSNHQNFSGICAYKTKKRICQCFETHSFCAFFIMTWYGLLNSESHKSTFKSYLIGTKSRGNKKSRELIVAQKYCATSRLFVPATFCFLILRDIKFPRLLVLKFCATISSTRLFVPRLFVPATFCSCDFLISNAKKTARLFKSRKNL